MPYIATCRMLKYAVVYGVSPHITPVWRHACCHHCRQHWIWHYASSIIFVYYYYLRCLPTHAGHFTVYALYTLVTTATRRYYYARHAIYYARCRHYYYTINRLTLIVNIYAITLAYMPPLVIMVGYHITPLRHTLSFVKMLYYIAWLRLLHYLLIVYACWLIRHLLLRLLYASILIRHLLCYCFHNSHANTIRRLLLLQRFGEGWEALQRWQQKTLLILSRLPLLCIYCRILFTCQTYAYHIYIIYDITADIRTGIIIILLR